MTDAKKALNDLDVYHARQRANATKNEQVTKVSNGKQIKIIHWESEIQVAVAAERARTLALAYRAVDEEEELDGPMPLEILDIDIADALRATVRATKRSIRARLAALIEEIEEG